MAITTHDHQFGRYPAAVEAAAIPRPTQLDPPLHPPSVSLGPPPRASAYAVCQRTLQLPSLLTSRCVSRFTLARSYSAYVYVNVLPRALRNKPANKALCGRETNVGRVHYMDVIWWGMIRTHRAAPAWAWAAVAPHAACAKVSCDGRSCACDE